MVGSRQEKNEEEEEVSGPFGDRWRSMGGGNALVCDPPQMKKKKKKKKKDEHAESVGDFCEKNTVFTN